MSEWLDYFKRSDRTLLRQATGNATLADLIVLAAPRGAKILEAGCGTALLSILLADYGFHVTALDLDTEVLDYARQHVPMSHLKIDFVQGSILELSGVFAPHQFDIACHSGVMEHFTDEEIVRSLGEQRKVARQLFFRVPNARTRRSSGHFGDERFLSNRHWRKLLRAAGYEHVKVLGGDSFPLWALLLPRALFYVPKHTYSPRLQSLASILMTWRKYISRHSIFVCR